MYNFLFVFFRTYLVILTVDHRLRVYLPNIRLRTFDLVSIIGFMQMKFSAQLQPELTRMFLSQIIDLSEKFSQELRAAGFGIVNERTASKSDQPIPSIKNSIYNDLRERTNAVAAVGKFFCVCRLFLLNAESFLDEFLLIVGTS